MKLYANLVNKIAFATVWPITMAATIISATAGENMIGHQSQKEGMLVLPAPGKVTIDGQLDDRGWSGRIWIFADTAVRSRHSVEIAAMLDTEYLYLGAKWKDPTPMFDLIDPAVNPNEGWKKDSCGGPARFGRPAGWFQTGVKPPARVVTTRWTSTG
jgi:hypothetical protein